MNNNVAADKSRRRLLVTALKYLGLTLGVLALVGGAAFAGWRWVAAQKEWEPGDMPSSAEIEEKFGVRFSYVAVTADGGMVELRYRVIDEGKAANFGHYTETSPMLVAEDSGKVVDVTIMGLHNHRVEPGRTYYVLYRNTGNAIQSHRPVTIAIGDMKLKHAVAW